MIDADDDGDPGEVVCGADDDYLPDPASPNHFYQCHNGVPVRMACPEGLVFDPNIRPGPVCVHPRDYDGWQPPES